jgi:hypothetical protein
VRNHLFSLNGKDNKPFRLTYSSGVSAKRWPVKAAGYRSPWTSAFSLASLISCSSCLLSWIDRDPKFSLTRPIFVDPGIGIMSSPCAMSQAIVNCGGVQFFVFATATNLSTSSRFLGKFSFEKRGENLLKSP